MSTVINFVGGGIPFAFLVIVACFAVGPVAALCWTVAALFVGAILFGE